jgi:hypothetical protein
LKFQCSLSCRHVATGKKFGSSFVQHPVIKRECGKFIRLVLIRFSLPFPDSVYTTSCSQTTFSLSSCPSKIFTCEIPDFKRKCLKHYADRTEEGDSCTFLDKSSYFSVDIAHERHYFKKLDMNRNPMLGAVPKLLSLQAFTAKYPIKSRAVSGVRWFSVINILIIRPMIMEVQSVSQTLHCLNHLTLF